ncbi:MAG: type II toxin-antitoxin system RelE/ParE family toxin [Cruoricaptor ignavus]|nr:type II toxin-antitoxin system RelE/ParE family toxin [Cruoricaptor ignavus]
MTKVILRREAINDLTDIWNYTLYKWSEKQADKYYQKIKLACKSIGENPSLGKSYPEISKHLLGLKCEKHIIFYCQISNSEIEIIRILHGRMDLKRRINE